MKVVLSGLVCGVLASVAPAWAEQVPASSSGGRASGQAKQVDQAIDQQQAKVRQLQDDVGKQESKTHQADDKLKQQDKAIADLQRQLDALKAAPQGSGHP
jgi:septal ring factor EnvC (AmiA/AmiB activator)